MNVLSCSSKLKVNEIKQLIAFLGSSLEYVWGAGTQVSHHPASEVSHADFMHANVHRCMKRRIAGVGFWTFLPLLLRNLFLSQLSTPASYWLTLQVLFLPLGSVLAAVLRPGETNCPASALGTFAAKREPLSLLLQRCTKPEALGLCCSGTFCYSPAWQWRVLGASLLLWLKLDIVGQHPGFCLCALSVPLPLL